MKQIDYTMRVKGINSIWNEDNSAIVPNQMTKYEHAVQTINKRNKGGNSKQTVLLTRQLPKKYIIKLQIDG